MKDIILKEANATIYFDRSNYLREQTVDPKKLEVAIVYLKDCGEDQDYAMLGYFYRVLGKTKQAFYYYQRCLQKAEDNGGDKSLLINSIRFGEVLKCAHLHDEALAWFRKASEIAHRLSVSEYDDFILQHKGKCLWEMNELRKARRCFEEAYALRLQKGDETLIESTKQALRLLV
ncbi:tetratricopeptide repeat protein [Shouchella hunanensis]|uniref:Tetratricopeptide repeat protein n=1 Tax=Shouchella hunanensis TaxID=766894 RepID=A0ABY7WA84_9BACI|nr:tetratricopeptide repeat protein [Shouchella hunanensis]WDF04722.1 tetratricopeptide repeat protein [Shouchella hunanensis]